ncbi:MAG: hypothetical protein E7252_05240 [Lachnospira sp.]|nr:hypothetical protein [Lachnospira sp.]
MKSIYILLTRSDSCVSRIIGLVTADNYTHVSISFDKSLQTLYSFARKYVRTPLPAGMIKEELDSGFLGKHNYIPCALYEIKVSDEAYAAAKKEVDDMAAHMDDYRFNIVGLFCCRMNIQLNRKRHYFCSQFVSKVLEKSKAVELPKPAALMRPSDYLDLEEMKCLFKGSIRKLDEYCANHEYETNRMCI